MSNSVIDFCVLIEELVSYIYMVVHLVFVQCGICGYEGVIVSFVSPMVN